MSFLENIKIYISNISKEEIDGIIKIYLEELIESLVLLSMYNYMVKDTINLTKILPMCLISALLSTLLGKYNSSYKNTIKNSVISNIGVSGIKTAIA